MEHLEENFRFQDLYWHDANLLNILIDRKNPGHIDQIRIEVDFPDIGRKKVVFDDCWKADIQMNFGIIANESILRVDVYEQSDEIEALRKNLKYSKLDNLKCFEIETNSTGGSIKIFAESFKVLK